VGPGNPTTDSGGKSEGLTDAVAQLSAQSSISMAHRRLTTGWRIAVRRNRTREGRSLNCCWCCGDMRKQSQERSRTGSPTVLRLHLDVVLIKVNEHTTKLRQALPSIVAAAEPFYTLAQLTLTVPLSTEMIRALRTHPADESTTRLARGEPANHNPERSRVLHGTSNRGCGERTRA
jgi:hypothetical protein